MQTILFKGSDSEFSTIFGKIDKPYFVISLSSVERPFLFVDANEAGLKLLSCSKKEIMEISLTDLVGTTLSENIENFRNAMEQKGFHEIRTKIYSKSNLPLYVNIELNRIIFDSQPAILACFTDLTELSEYKTLSEETLKTTETLIERAPFGIITHQDYIIKQINPKGMSVLNIAESEIVGKSILDFFPEELTKERQEKIEWVHNSKLSYAPVKTTMLSIDKVPINVEISDAYINIDKRSAILTMFEDISEEAFAQSELQRRQTFLESHLNAAPNGIVMVNPEGIIMEWNPSAERMFGYRRHEVLGKNIFNVVCRPDVIMEAKNLFKLAIAGKADETVETIRYRKDDNPKNVRIKASRIRENNKNLGIIYYYIDTEHIQEAEVAIKQSEFIIRETLFEITKALAKALELRDAYTSGHGQAVSIIAKSIAEKLGWSQDRIMGLELAGLLHDIGKLGVPIEILTKPKKLNEYELRLIQEHPHMGYDLLKKIPFQAPIAEAVYQHHERVNGKGYPRGLKAGQILPEAKILAVADLLDAMSSHRPYRAGHSMEEVVERLKELTDSVYDREISMIALQILKENNYTKYWLYGNGFDETLYNNS